MSIAKAALLEPLVGSEIPVTKAAAVIGGGITGMTAALDIAAQGIPVHLFEKEKELGGFARKVRHKEDGKDVAQFIKELICKVEGNPKITIYKGADIKDIPGFVGNFKIVANGKEIPVGAVLFATGAAQYKPTEYGYGSDKKVMTAMELEEALAAGKFTGKNVAFVQCVGSRNSTVKYCSRVCCASSLRNAIQIKMNDPTASVAIKLWIRNLFTSTAFIRPNNMPMTRQAITATNHGVPVSNRIVANAAPAAVPIKPGERSNSPSRIGKDTATANGMKSTIELRMMTMLVMRR
jgi:heterodisulfide reductase subunit A-like polyferredoxin